MFVVQRPKHEIFNPILKLFEPRYDLEDILLPAALVAFCGGQPASRGHNSQIYASCKTGNSNFTLKVEAPNFLPEELDVKIVDNFIVVTGKHEEKEDDTGFISRQFVRRYEMPEGVNAESITCNLKSDGVLLISAPKANEKEIKIPISISENHKTGIDRQTQQKEVSRK